MQAMIPRTGNAPLQLPGAPSTLSEPLPFAPLAPPLRPPTPAPVPKGVEPDVPGAPDQSSSGAMRLAINGLVMLVVLALIGVPILIGLQHLNATSPSPTATAISATRVPTAAPPSGMDGFLGSDYSIAYPSNWVIRHATQRTDYGSARVDTFAQDDGTLVSILTVSAIPSDLLQTGMDAIGKTQLSGASPTPTQTSLRMTYNSLTWLEDDFTVSLAVNGVAASEQVRVLGASAGLTTYVIVLLAPQSGFDTTNTSTFEPMLNSLRLG